MHPEVVLGGLLELRRVESHAPMVRPLVRGKANDRLIQSLLSIRRIPSRSGRDRAFGRPGRIPNDRPAAMGSDRASADGADLGLDAGRRSSARPSTGRPRSARTRFGPRPIRRTATRRTRLPPHLALGSSRCTDWRVATAGDVEIARRVERRSPLLEECRSSPYAVAEAAPVAGLVLGGDRTIALPDATARLARDTWLRPRIDDRSSTRTPTPATRLQLARRRTPTADAPADRVGAVLIGATVAFVAARRPVPADRAAWLLARPRDAVVDGRAAHAVLRDDRDRRAAASTRA